MSELSGGPGSADHQQRSRRRRRREVVLAIVIVALIAAAGVFALSGDDGSSDEPRIRRALEQPVVGDTEDEVNVEGGTSTGQ